MIRIFLALALMGTAEAAPLPLMPVPVQAAAGTGQLRIDGRFRVGGKGYSDSRLAAAVARFITRVSRQTGIPLSAAERGAATLVVECVERGSTFPAAREDEAYQLDVSSSEARLTAHTVTGALRGLETFSQLIVPGAEGF